MSLYYLKVLSKYIKQFNKKTFPKEQNFLIHREFSWKLINQPI